ncbi:hypothetical protein MVEN_01028000 [Mycena venus]|uniref:Uncharacterized protein n=1 Tax=Mycena venus TaxID=2733690 RepID=A0A8H7D2S2_9AGAR|nr:hypothetical protein MVEN_01028000 [Mycena venus]
MLESPDPEARSSSCWLLGALGSHEEIISAVLELKPYMWLVSLLRRVQVLRHNSFFLSCFSDKDSSVIARAIYALCQIARWSDGAQAIVDARALDGMLAFLESSSSDIRKWTCELVGRLVEHESTVQAILGLQPCAQLLSVLQDEDAQVTEWATYALSQISLWSDGAQAMGDAKALDRVLILLESQRPRTRERACELVGRLTFHKSTAPTIMELQACGQLVCLLSDDDPRVILRATHALAQFAVWVDCAQMIVDAQALDHVLRLLKCLGQNVRKWACKLVGRLASHEPTVRAISESNVSAVLLSLLCEPAIRSSAIFALGAISGWPDGVAALADIDAFKELQELINSELLDSDTRDQTCRILDNLARYKAVGDWSGRGGKLRIVS